MLYRPRVTSKRRAQGDAMLQLLAEESFRWNTDEPRPMRPRCSGSVCLFLPGVTEHRPRHSRDLPLSSLDSSGEYPPLRCRGAELVPKPKLVCEFGQYMVPLRSQPDLLLCPEMLPRDLEQPTSGVAPSQSLLVRPAGGWLRPACSSAHYTRLTCTNPLSWSPRHAGETDGLVSRVRNSVQWSAAFMANEGQAMSASG